VSALPLVELIQKVSTNTKSKHPTNEEEEEEEEEVYLRLETRKQEEEEEFCDHYRGGGFIKVLRRPRWSTTRQGGDDPRRAGDFRLTWGLCCNRLSIESESNPARFLVATWGSGGGRGPCENVTEEERS